MKTKLMAGILVASGLMFSGTGAAASWSWTGTIADWGNWGSGTGVITDGDGDVQFKLFNTTSIPASSVVSITETELGGKDYYDLGVGWGPDGYSGGGQLVYTMTIVDSAEQITSAAMETIITGTETTALKILRDLPENEIFLNLSSFNGIRDPLTGYAEFAGRTTIGVQDIFMSSESGVFQDAHNSYGTTVPEPISLSLFGIGLVGLFLSRRRTD